MGIFSGVGDKTTCFILRSDALVPHLVAVNAIHKTESKISFSLVGPCQCYKQCKMNQYC